MEAEEISLAKKKQKKFKIYNTRLRAGAPVDTSLLNQFQMAEVIQAFYWCHKFFVFLSPIRGQYDWESCCVFLHGMLHRGQLLAMFVWVVGLLFLLKDEGSNHSTKSRANSTAKKFAVNKLELLQIS